MRKDHTQKSNKVFMKYYEDYSDDIFRFCMIKTSSRDQSLDYTQETFMKFWSYIKDDNAIDNPRALLYRIAGNLVIDGYRKKKDFLVDSYIDDSLQDEITDNPTPRMENHIDGEKALTLLNQLTPLSAEIITLKFLGGLSVTEIAPIVERDAKTVSVYLHRGLKKLEEIIKKTNGK